MFKKILSPIDLAHVEKLEKALTVTSEMARAYGAEVCFISVTGSSPGALGRTPEESKRHMAEFAAAQAEKFGIQTSSRVIISPDPSVDMNRNLAAAVRDSGADLVVMATHPPGISDYIWSGHGAHLAAHSEASVMLIRG